VEGMKNFTFIIIAYFKKLRKNKHKHTHARTHFFAEKYGGSKEGVCFYYFKKLRKYKHIHPSACTQAHAHSHSLTYLLTYTDYRHGNKPVFVEEKCKRKRKNRKEKENQKTKSTMKKSKKKQINGERPVNWKIGRIGQLK
jgi:hypothetical protein